MAKIHCRSCRTFLAELERYRVVGIIEHSDEKQDGHEVLRCGSCGSVHELRRLEEAA